MAKRDGYMKIKKCRVVHFKKEPYDILITRPGKWGCPFSHKKGTLAEFVLPSRKEAIEAYKNWITTGEGQYLLKDLHELRGKVLGCWCKDIGGGGKSCHGDVLAELVNNLDKPKVGFDI